MCRKLYYVVCSVVFFFKQKTAYEMRIGDGSSDVCSSDLRRPSRRRHGAVQQEGGVHVGDGSAVGFGAAAQRHALCIGRHLVDDAGTFQPVSREDIAQKPDSRLAEAVVDPDRARRHDEKIAERSEEHTSELQSLMRISYAVFCLKKT